MSCGGTHCNAGGDAGRADAQELLRHVGQLSCAWQPCQAELLLSAALSACGWKLEAEQVQLTCSPAVEEPPFVTDTWRH